MNMRTPIPYDEPILPPFEPRAIPVVRSRRYLIHLLLFWLLLSVFDIGFERDSEYGLQRLERLWRGSNAIGSLTSNPDPISPGLAPELGLTNLEFTAGNAASEAYLNYLHEKGSSVWNRGVEFAIGDFRIQLGGEIIFNLIPAFFFAMMFWLRDRQVAAEGLIEEQNRVYQQLNQALERRVRESQRIIEKLDTMRSQLVQAEKLASIGRLAATLAHEIRNPLTIIKSSMDIVNEEVTGESGSTAAIGLMRDEINRMDRIITDLLNFSRPKPPDITHYDLSTLVRHWLPPVVEELEREDIQLVPQLDEPGEAAVDADQLYQVFLNVMWNARDALKGHPNPHVFVRTVDAGADFIDLVVQDTGPGMIPDVLGQIREPFYTTKTQGTGLGLPVTVQLIEGMNGAVDIESELEVGTTVRLRLARAGSRFDRMMSSQDAAWVSGPGE